MFKYILKRIGISLIVLLGVSVMVFVFIQKQPGNPYLNMINPNMTAVETNQMLTNLGYFDPIHIKFFKWIKMVSKGDLGHSIQYGQPVTKLIGSRIGNTFILALGSTIISISIAIPFGIISAYKKGKLIDLILTVISFLGVSIPSFFLGLLLIKVFSFNLAMLPISGMRTIGKDFTGIKNLLDVTKHMILPVFVLSFVNIASLMRHTRSSMLNVIKEDYIRTARSKGLSEKKAILVHGFRNALITIITLLSMQIPSLFSGALITETIFAWPGIGRLNYDAVLNRDYPVVMGVLLVTAIIILISNLIADILYVIIDPRIGNKV